MSAHDMSDDDLAAYRERVAESQALEDMRERRKEREIRRERHLDSDRRFKR